MIDTTCRLGKLKIVFAVLLIGAAVSYVSFVLIRESLQDRQWRLSKSLLLRNDPVLTNVTFLQDLVKEIDDFNSPQPEISDKETAREDNEHFSVSDELVDARSYSHEYHNNLSRNLALAMQQRHSKIFQVLPSSGFDQSLKNPCWWKNEYLFHKVSESYYWEKFVKTWRSAGHSTEDIASTLLQKRRPVLYCLPYFFIIGLPKCGTTDLYMRLSKHPQIVPPLQKEPHWWDKRRVDHNVSFLDYLFLFSLPTKMIRAASLRGLQLVTFEASASTMLFPRRVASDAAHELIFSVLPQAKLIVILRNPVDRLYSDYLYFNCIQHNETDKCSAQQFHLLVVKATSRFVQCLSSRAIGFCVAGDKLGHPKLSSGLYYYHLLPWLRLFPLGEQLLVLCLESHSANLVESMRRTFKFLDLDSMTDEKMSEIAALPRANTVGNDFKAKVGPMLFETRELLTSFYQPHNRQLAKLLQDDDFLWKISVASPVTPLSQQVISNG